MRSGSSISLHPCLPPLPPSSLLPSLSARPPSALFKCGAASVCLSLLRCSESVSMHILHVCDVLPSETRVGVSDCCTCECLTTNTRRSVFSDFSAAACGGIVSVHKNWQAVLTGSYSVKPPNTSCCASIFDTHRWFQLAAAYRCTVMTLLFCFFISHSHQSIAIRFPLVRLEKWGGLYACVDVHAVRLCLPCVSARASKHADRTYRKKPSRTPLLLFLVPWVEWCMCSMFRKQIKSRCQQN